MASATGVSAKWARRLRVSSGLAIAAWLIGCLGMLTRTAELYWPAFVVFPVAAVAAGVCQGVIWKSDTR